jgi:hypothetical protein
MSAKSAQMQTKASRIGMGVLALLAIAYVAPGSTQAQPLTIPTPDPICPETQAAASAIRATMPVQAIKVPPGTPPERMQAVTMDILAKQMSAKYGALADQFDACATHRLGQDDRSGWAHAKVEASIARLSIANVVLSAHHSGDAAGVLHLIANDLGAVLALPSGVAEARDLAVARSVLQTVEDELQGIADKGDAYSLRDRGSATPQPSPT